MKANKKKVSKKESPYLETIEPAFCPAHYIIDEIHKFLNKHKIPTQLWPQETFRLIARTAYLDKEPFFKFLSEIGQQDFEENFFNDEEGAEIKDLIKKKSRKKKKAS